MANRAMPTSQDPPAQDAKRRDQIHEALRDSEFDSSERGTPKNRKSIDWKLVTDLPVQSRKDALEKLE